MLSGILSIVCYYIMNVLQLHYLYILKGRKIANLNPILERQYLDPCSHEHALQSTKRYFINRYIQSDKPSPTQANLLR